MPQYDTWKRNAERWDSELPWGKREELRHARGLWFSEFDAQLTVNTGEPAGRLNDRPSFIWATANAAAAHGTPQNPSPDEISPSANVAALCGAAIATASAAPQIAPRARQVA